MRKIIILATAAGLALAGCSKAEDAAPAETAAAVEATAAASDGTDAEAAGTEAGDDRGNPGDRG